MMTKQRTPTELVDAALSTIERAQPSATLAARAFAMAMAAPALSPFAEWIAELVRVSRIAALSTCAAAAVLFAVVMTSDTSSDISDDVSTNDADAWVAAVLPWSV